MRTPRTALSSAKTPPRKGGRRAESTRETQGGLDLVRELARTESARLESECPRLRHPLAPPPILRLGVRNIPRALVLPRSIDLRRAAVSSTTFHVRQRFGSLRRCVPPPTSGDRSHPETPGAYPFSELSLDRVPASIRDRGFVRARSPVARNWSTAS